MHSTPETLQILYIIYLFENVRFGAKPIRFGASGFPTHNVEPPDNTTVSAWGESAGGGSILHHLIRNGGKEDPLFTGFVTQSPAFEWAWNNSNGGQLDQVYQNFSKSLGCNDPNDISCIRDPSIPLDKLAMANVKLFESVKQTGLFPIGPSVDDTWIKTVPTLAFAKGNFWSGIKSAIVSHCVNDAERFTPPSVVNNTTFYGFLDKFLPGQELTSVRAKIAKQYNCTADFKGDYNLCLRQVIRDASFTCNTRDLLDAYPKQAYAMNYGFPNDSLAYHASDLIPLFADAGMRGEIAAMIRTILRCSVPEAFKWANKLRDTIRKPYLGYFASFAVYGNTDSDGKGDTEWPVVDGSGELFSQVMKPSQNGWDLVQDEQNSKKACDFWRKRAQDLMPQSGSSGWNLEEVDFDEDVQEEL
ncbi:Alpha/Beta hydrolase protein [Fusarium avenaceum]|nr:Alpha/Beta hydrolase protein [Fusarium avenaceum]